MCIVFGQGGVASGPFTSRVGERFGRRHGERDGN